MADVTETPDNLRPPAVQAPAQQQAVPPSGQPQTVRPSRPSLPSPLAVITAALGLFFVVLTLLAVQVRNGRDPALGPGPVTPTRTATGGTAQQATSIVTRSSPVPP